MTLEQFQQLLLQKKTDIEHAMRRTLPVKVGRIAKDHFQDNFRNGGFVNNGRHPWQRTHRQETAQGAARQYGPLMSSRQNLYGSIYYHPEDAKVTVGTNLPYAAIHNEGGDIVVTARMKRFFWAKYRETNGGTWARSGNNPEAEFWKSLALKSVGTVIHIPKRQFIGESKELDTKVNDTIEKELKAAKGLAPGISNFLYFNSPSTARAFLMNSSVVSFTMFCSFTLRP